MSDEAPNHELSKPLEDERLDASEGIGGSGSSSNKPEPRRRASRAGTRSVATLTEAQLARKRANDREAQRSIRQRTKDRIERLEQRIKELTEGHNDERSFEEIQRRNEALEEELRQLKDGALHPDNMILPGFPPRLPAEYIAANMPPRSMGYQPPWSIPNVSPGPSGLSTSYTTPNFNSVFSSQGSVYSPSESGSSPSEMSSASDYFGRIRVDSPPIPSNPPLPNPPIRPQISLQRPSTGGDRPGIVRSVSYPDTRTQQAWSPGPFAFSGIGENAASGSSFMVNRQPARARRLSPMPSSKPLTPSITSMPSMLPNSSSRHGSHGSLAASPLLTPLTCGNSSSRQGSLSSDPPVSNSTISSRPPSRQLYPTSLSPSLHVLPSTNICTQALPRMANDPSSGRSSEIHPVPTMSTTPLQNSLPTSYSSFYEQQSSINLWDHPLHILKPTCPVDALLSGILQRQKSLAMNGATGELLTGPYFLTLQALLYPERSNDVHPILSVLSNMLLRTGLRRLSEKVAALFVIYRLTQWQISPTPETYYNLPEWYRPRSSQLITPHPIWVSLIIWGHLRDIVIQNQDRYGSEEFQNIYTENLNINWPYRDDDMLKFEGNEIKIAEAYIKHITNIDNWSMDEMFVTRYPELRDCVNVTGCLMSDLVDTGT